MSTSTRSFWITLDRFGIEIEAEVTVKVLWRYDEHEIVSVTTAEARLGLDHDRDLTDAERADIEAKVGENWWEWEREYHDDIAEARAERRYA